MSVLTGNNLARRFGPLDVFQGVNVRIEKGDRIGLVGPNGEGKTTLLRLLAGLDAPSEGAVFRMRGLSIGFLPQDPPPAGAGTLWQDVSAVYEPLRRQAEVLRRLEERMAHPPEYEEALAQYGPLQARFEAAGGYQWELNVRQVLTGLGFPPSEHAMPLAHLSGGQRTRGLLARILLEKPDLLLLDEPTNHLDLEATEWLEQILLQWSGSIVVVSHDRYFLDKVVTRIWEMAAQTLEIYRGNYSHYVQQRAERRERQRREWQRQQAFIAKEEDFIRRNIAGQNTRQAQGRRTRLERLEREGGFIEKPQDQQTIRLQMDARLRSGNLVLSTQNLAIGFHSETFGERAAPRREEVSGGYVYSGPGDELSTDDDAQQRLLFRAPDLELKRGERVALIGPNGAGKSTFLKTVLGQMPPFSGRLRVGASVQIGYLAQAHSELLPDMSVLDSILEKAPHMEMGRARSFLGRFLFQGDDVFKSIQALSGGQRSRVALARLTLEGANFLLLDEPTNHLDIASQEVLESVLNEFPGTVLLVTHDRYLVDAIATQVWALREGELRIYRGNYTRYAEARLAEEEMARVVQSKNGDQPTDSQLHREQARAERRRRKELEQRQEEAERLEELIAALEERLQQLGSQLSQASKARQTERVHTLGLEYQSVDQRLHQLMKEWSELTS